MHVCIYIYKLYINVIQNSGTAGRHRKASTEPFVQPEFVLKNSLLIITWDFT